MSSCMTSVVTSMKTVARLCCLFLGDRAFLPPPKLKATGRDAWAMEVLLTCGLTSAKIGNWSLQSQAQTRYPLNLQSSAPGRVAKSRSVHVPPNQTWKDSTGSTRKISCSSASSCQFTWRDSSSTSHCVTRARKTIGKLSFRYASSKT